MPSRDAGFAALILAAGQGRRMNSPLAKVLHPLGGEPMIRHVVAAAREADAAPIVIVVGHQAAAVRGAFADDGKGLIFAVQERRLGTAHAAGVGLSALPIREGHLFLLCGDAPLIRAATLRHLGRHHARARAAATMLTAIAEDPAGYGRVVRKGAELAGVVEEADATDAQRRIAEVNTGAYVFDLPFLRAALPGITPENSQGEFYLPDVLAVARTRGRPVLGVPLATPREGLGVNTQADLRKAEEIHRRRNSRG